MNDDDFIAQSNRKFQERVEQAREESDREFRKKHGIPEMPPDPPKMYIAPTGERAKESSMTAEQRLQIANARAFERERERALQAIDAPLTDEDIAPYSRAEFLKLRPELRLDIVNRAKARREKGASK